MLKKLVSSALVLALISSSVPRSYADTAPEALKTPQDVLKTLLSLGGAELLKSEGVTLISNVNSKPFTKESSVDLFKDGVTVAYTSSEYSDLSGEKTLAIRYTPSFGIKGEVTLMINPSTYNLSTGTVEASPEAQNGFGSVIDLNTQNGVEEAKLFIQSSETTIFSKWKSENQFGSRFKLRSAGSLLSSIVSKLIPSAHALTSCSTGIILTAIFGSILIIPILRNPKNLAPLGVVGFIAAMFLGIGCLK